MVIVNAIVLARAWDVKAGGNWVRAFSKSLTPTKVYTVLIK